MKFEKVRTFLFSFFLSALLGIGTVACLATGFSLTLSPWAMLAIFAWALLSSLLLPRRRGGLWLISIAAVAAGYLWRQGSLYEQLCRLLYRISHTYHSAYHWGYLLLSDHSRSAGPTDLPLAVWGCITAFFTARCLSNRKRTFLAAVFIAVPLLLCLVVTDTVPAPLPLAAVLLGLVLLLLTAGTRRESASQGSRLGLQCLIPVALAAGLLFLAVPADGYVDHSAEVREKLLSFFNQIPHDLVQTAQGIVSPRPGASKHVDLSVLGPQSTQSLPVLEVRSVLGGPVYLRYQDYNRYTGTGWESTDNREESFSGAGEILEEIGVRTLTGSHSGLYLPYYPAPEVMLQGGAAENSGRNRVYYCSRYAEGATLPSVSETYLQLPEATAAGAEALVSFPSDASADEIAALVRDFVRGSALYDRDTGRMPSGEEDFALWFLRQSETGYCVHFATAAVVLLRAQGVPARYVTGYLAVTSPDVWTTVQASQAHAWAEYYDNVSHTWKLLDATPEDLTQEETVPTASSETEALPAVTRPREAEETEEFSPPTDATVPPDVSAPVDLSWLKDAVAVLLTVGLAAALCVLQRLCRLFFRHRRWTTGSTASQALALWQEAEALSALLGQAPPDALMEIAQKAKYSRHAMTQPELEPLRAYLRQCRGKLRRAPWYRRVYYRWILVAY